MMYARRNPQDMGKGGSGNPASGVIPPAFEQLCRKRNRRKPVLMNSFRVRWRVCYAPTGGIGIMEDALRMEGRAVACCLPGHKKASPYVSYEAVMHKREQRLSRWSFSVLMNW